MSTVPSITASDRPSGLFASTLRHSGLVNVLVKEIREARGAIIAGLAIFWVMPAFLEVMYYLIDPDHEFIEGFAVGLLAVAGWLYAIVIGSHTVCRDWGKAEERFLLAQPISPRVAVLAKLLAGVVTIAIVFAAGVFWDLLAVWISPLSFAEPEFRVVARVGLVLLGLSACGYAIASAASVVTRQMLASVLLSALTLLLWAVTPLLSVRLMVLHPDWRMVLPEEGSIGWTFPAIVALAIAGCLVIAFVAAGRERKIRLGHKPLAWTVALVVLSLFGMAYMEVGNALTVTDQAILPMNDPHAPVAQYFRAAQHGDLVYAVGGCFHTPDKRTPAQLSLASFRVGQTGKITDVRRTTLPLPDGLRGQTAEGKGRSAMLEAIAVNDAGELLAMGLQRIVEKRIDDRGRTGTRRHRVGLWRAKYAWPEGESPRLLSLIETPLPCRDDRHAAQLMRCVLTDSHAYYLVYAKASERQAARNKTGTGFRWDRAQLLALDWSDGAKAKPRYELDLPGEVCYLRASDGKVMLQDTSAMNLVTFDPDRPEALAALKPKLRKWGTTLADREAIAQYASMFGIVDPRVAITTNGDVTYVRHLFGLKVLRWDPSPGVEDFTLVGECGSSPLAKFGREPILVDDTLYIEHDSLLGPVLGFFDVSDPTRPRRLGFLHDHRFWAEGGRDLVRTVPATAHHLVFLRPRIKWETSAALEVTVAKRPRTARPPPRSPASQSPQ